METTTSKQTRRFRKQVTLKERQMIARVYAFLRNEYDFMRLNNFDDCNLKPLSSVIIRTANATGVSSSYVSAVNASYRDCFLTTLPKISPLTHIGNKPESSINYMNVNKDNASAACQTYPNITHEIEIDNALIIKKERHFPNSSNEGDRGKHTIENIGYVPAFKHERLSDSADDTTYDKNHANIKIERDATESSDDELLIDIKRKRCSGDDSISIKQEYCN